MVFVDFMGELHTRTKRDYVQRVVEHDKALCAETAIQYGKDYWDGDRKYGFGGYKYDGRWRGVAEKMARHYGLKAGDKVLDVGCGKGFLLYELTELIPGIEISGIDISKYAIENAKPEVKPFLKIANATSLPFGNNVFDFVVSITTLHNLYNYDLHAALKEIERVGKKKKHVTVESYRTEREKMNLLYWQLTCRAFLTPKEWEWMFSMAGYTGDYGAIFFE